MFYYTRVSQKVTQFLSQEARILIKFVEIRYECKAHIVMRFSYLIVFFRIGVGNICLVELTAQ